ncbi:MAG: hypothetical protein Q8L86_15920 [Vicinamibacterales bacterium]|nr:hypothetical protein [Vicinamibacterales bacterium]
MPGDVRLVGAVRDLAAHAAAYAKLEARVADGLARQVAAATEAAIVASGAQDAPVDVRFVREAGTLTVSIGLDADAAAAWPPSAEAGLTVEASRAGTRETCRITQRLA